jgi:hypothetical protein
MEISEIQKAKSVSQLRQKEGVQQTKVVDHLSISFESEKKAIWVEMLKEMPDLRPEKVEAALDFTLPTSYRLAQKILNS